MLFRSFPCDLLSQGGTDLPGWRPVRKLIRRFSAASGQSRARVAGLGEEPGCEVELTEVRVGGQAWWTLGFEATGPASLLSGELKAAAALVFAQALPGGVELGTDDSQSYAQWLAAARFPATPAPEAVPGWHPSPQLPGIAAGAPAHRRARRCGGHAASVPRAIGGTDGQDL